jgi:hypothetical protein
MRPLLVGVAVLGCVAAQAGAEPRSMRPEDLFRFARVGAIAWSARGNVLDLWRRFEAWLRETMPPE